MVRCRTAKEVIRMEIAIAFHVAIDMVIDKGYALRGNAGGYSQDIAKAIYPAIFVEGDVHLEDL